MTRANNCDNGGGSSLEPRPAIIQDAQETQETQETQNRIARLALPIPKGTTLLGSGLVIPTSAADRLAKETAIKEKEAQLEKDFIESLYPSDDRQKAFEATQEALEVARRVGDAHKPITLETINEESLAFLSDPHVMTFLRRLQAENQEFHISFDPAERFSKEALKELAISASILRSDRNEPTKGIPVIDKANIEELSGDMIPSTENGRLRFAIYLDGSNAPDLLGTVYDMRQQEKKLQSKNPAGLRYVARKYIQEGIFNALQMREQGKLKEHHNDGYALRRITRAAAINQIPIEGSIAFFEACHYGKASIGEGPADSMYAVGVVVEKIPNPNNKHPQH